MDEELAKRLADYFTGPELLDLIDVPVEELVALLWDPYILDRLEEINDYINYGN